MISRDRGDESTSRHFPPRTAIRFMKWRDWLELLMPTVLVGLAWFGLSAATTVYITWLDRRHGEILTENVSSILASAEMQHALWELQVSLVTSAPNIAPEAEAAFQTACDRARQVCSTANERECVDVIAGMFSVYRQESELARETPSTPMSTDHAATLAAGISKQCDQLRRINEAMIEKRTLEHRKWTDRVVTARLVVNILGPLLGVWLGYRVASRLRRRLTAIHVTLEGAAIELGQVLVGHAEADDTLGSIDRQVRAVADRLHQVVAERDVAQRDARRNERLAAVGELATGIAHELRNPLTAVKLLVQTAAHKNAGAGLRADQATVVQEEISRMESTIQSLLDFARPAATRRFPCDLRDALRRAVNLVAGRAEHDGVRIVLPGDSRPLHAVCDPEQVHQIFLNLLLNGMDAMPDGGDLTIEFRAGLDPLDSFCEIVVLDEGHGIPPELVDRIFDPFVTTKARGTGLGLAISRRLVEEHGGRLIAENRPGGGAAFSVRLPRGEPPPPLPRRSASTRDATPDVQSFSEPVRRIGA